MDVKSKITYKTFCCSELTDELLASCSQLFSEHYGTYSGAGGRFVKGQRIKLSPKYYANFAKNPNMWVSLAFSGDKLIGQCFFLRKSIADGKVCTWVTQLVVHSFYRNRRIGTKLLQSAWGFSDYYAWGLATASSLTIRTLESVTWRKVEPRMIEKNLTVIEDLCDEISFADFKRIDLGAQKSQIFTNFYPEADGHDARVYVERLGKLQDGYEWLAFTFREQEMSFTPERMEQLLATSAEQLNEAYSRMNMGNQPWTRHTVSEIDFVKKHCNLCQNAKILDMGCGIGRHSIELAHRGFNVVGVDMSDVLLEQARKLSKKLPVTFYARDCRNLTVRGTFDVVICLYDVIGSYRTYAENESIVRSIHKKLKKKGRAVVSVMNMELTQYIATKCISVRRNPSELLRLKASNIMQSTGNVFNPDYFILDKDDHLVYRKEQFERDGYLSAEYVVADYRFTKQEIEDMFCRNGFEIIDSRYVQAGRWNTLLSATDDKAKEIVLVVEKE